MPVRITGRRTEHAHILGEEGLAPCPPGCLYTGTIKIGGITYCTYDCDGVDMFLRC